MAAKASKSREGAAGVYFIFKEIERGYKGDKISSHDSYNKE